MILFVSMPTEILDNLARKSLAVKFSEFSTVPLWFVVTNAEHYNATFGDWGSLDEGRFHDDLLDFRHQLEGLTSNSDDERNELELVIKNVEFKIGVNTFLVDGKHCFRIAELLRKIQETFGTADANLRKKSKLRDELQSEYSRCDDAIAKADEHINKLAHSLRLASSTVVRLEVSRFISSTITSGAALTAQHMFARLREAPFRLQPIGGDGLSVVPSAYGLQPLEVSLVERQIDEMKQERRSPGFFYRREEMLVPTERLIALMNELKSETVDSLRNDLDRHFTKALSSVLAGDARFSQDPEWYTNTMETVVKKDEDLRKEMNPLLTRQRTALRECLHRPVFTLMELYADADVAKTVFQRQRSLLDHMQISILSRIERLRKGLDEGQSGADHYADDRVRDLQTLVDRRLRDLKENTFRHLEQAVYLPTKECLEFLFAGQETIEEPTVIRIASDFEPTAVAAIGQVYPELVAEVKVVRERSIGDLDRIQQSWRAEWQILNEEFGKLVNHAAGQGKRLGQKLETLESVLDRAKADSLSVTYKALTELRGALRSLFETHGGLIEQAFRASKQTGQRKLILEYFFLALGIVTAGLTFWQTNFPKSWSEVTGRSVGVWAVLVLIITFVLWRIRRVLSSRASLDAVFRSNYEVRRGDFLDQVGKTCQETTMRLRREVDVIDTQLGTQLLELYDESLDICEGASRQLLPELLKQVQSAAKMAEETSSTVTTISERGMSDIADIVNLRLNRVCEGMDMEIRKTFAELAENLGDHYASILERYASRYRQISKELQAVRAKLKVSQLDLAG